MNLLTGGIFKEKSLNPMDFEIEYYGVNLNIQRILCFKDSIKHYIISCNKLYSLVGYIINLNEIKSQFKLFELNDIEIISFLFEKFANKFVDYLDGDYIITIFFKEGKLLIFNSYFGSALPLYYVSENNNFFFSTSLKDIILLSSKVPSLNYKSVNNFISLNSTRSGGIESNHIISNRNTFINGVCKLLPNQYLEYDINKLKLQLHFSSFQISSQFILKSLFLSISDNVNLLASSINSNCISVTLSGGYDTNYLLHCLYNEKVFKINTFTVGGIERNEIPDAKKISGLYNLDNVNLVVPSNTLGNFPDIVWRYDGYVCEKGLFLQYILASLLAQNKSDSVILGDCADQFIISKQTESVQNILHKSLLKDSPKVSELKTLFENLKTPFYQGVYDREIDYIHKKSGIILNSYGVQGVYPFVSKSIFTCSRALILHNKNKEYYKTEVTNRIGIPAGLLKKKGGATDVGYLLSYYSSLKENVLSTVLTKKILNKKLINSLINTNKYDFYYTDLYLKIIYINIFEKLFIKEHDFIKQNKIKLEMKLEDIFQ